MPDLEKLSWVNIVQSLDCSNCHALIGLDEGEKHTLYMALTMKADRVIIDEKIGRNIAEYLGLSVVGTLGVLLKAKRKGLVSSFSDCALAMQQHGIRYNTNLLKKLAAEVGENF